MILPAHLPKMLGRFLEQLRSRAAWIAVGYALFATLWILFSDQALSLLFNNPEDFVRWSVYKGIAFVVLTSGLLLLLMHRAFGAMEAGYAFLQAQQGEIQRLNQLYNAHRQINQAIARVSGREEMLRRICAVLVEHGGFRLAWVGWHDPATQQLDTIATAGAGGDYIRSLALFADKRPEGQGPTGRAFRNGRPYVCNDVAFDPIMEPWRGDLLAHGLPAMVALPLRQGGHSVGVINVFASRAGYFQERELELLTEAADDLSFALESYAREEERRRAEARAHGERTFSDTMIDSMPGVLYFYDTNGRFLRWNKNFERVSGYGPDEIAHLHPLDFFAPEERAAVEARIAEVFTTGESSVEASFRAKDGRRTPYFFTGRRVEFEGRTCLVGAGIDISERRRAELVLGETQERLRVVVENLREGLVIAEPGGDFLHWNPAALRLLGFDDADEGRRWQRRFSEVFELHTLDGAALPPEDWPLVRVRRGETLDNVEVRVRRRAGDWERILSYTGSQVTYAGGRTLAFLTLQDITARKRTERLLRDTNENLERAVAARTAELQSALERAEAADRIKSAFLATMSHELRTPLNSIIGFTGIVLQGLAGPLNPEQTKQLGMVRTSARHLLELINDVLDISKIESGQLEVRAEPFDLDDALARIGGLVRPLAEKRGLALELRAAPPLGHVTGDRRRVEQILLNLLNNAVKFTERGRVTLEAARLPSGAVRLRVTDTGIGIKPADLASLFQPFRQIDSGLARQHEGTGLGLAICRRLAELMGGDIAAASEWGQGSVFTVHLPLPPVPPP